MLFPSFLPLKKVIMQFPQLRKVFEILKIRFRKGYLKIFLNGFQKYYDNKAFNRYFKFFLENYDADKILGYTIGTSEILAGWLDKEIIIKEVVGTFLEHGYGFIDFINRFRFNNMSKLVIECKKGIYIYCDKELYLLTEPEFLLETIKSFNSEEQAYFANNYLSKVPLSAFQEMILIYINSNFGKPDNPYKKKFWEHINDFAKDQYTKWLIGKTLKDFFGESERFRFWSHFLNNIQNYYLVESRGQLFLDFGPIVVIEFRNSGNAAYIYKRSDFDKYFRRYTNESNSVSNAILKNQDIAFERIIHQGDWEYRAITIIGGAIENANR
jgi:hypothetical protein